MEHETYCESALEYFQKEKASHYASVITEYALLWLP